MSGGPVCAEKGHRHVVLVRRGNYSAFNGYHRTYSDYSDIRCINRYRDNKLGPEGAFWRAKGKYVDELPDATADDVRAIGYINPEDAPR